MKIKSIIAALVLAGSSTAAMASPVTFSGSAQAGVSIQGGFSYGTSVRDHRVNVRDHRTDDRYYATYQPPAPLPADDGCSNVSLAAVGSIYNGWVGAMPASGHANIALTAPTKILNGSELITVGAQKGGFTQLTLRGNAGNTYVRGVQVVMGKGDVQWVPVNRWIGANTSFSFDIDGRRGRMLDTVTVFGTSNFGSLYSITAER